MSPSTLTKWLSLALLLTSSMSPRVNAAPSYEQAASETLSATASSWSTISKNNVCGLTNPRQLTQPARIDYRTVLEATAEMKDLKQRGISLDSAEGQILRERAADRVRQIGSKLMRKRGHCSLWKEISHRDGRQIPDLTSALIASINAA
jgi:hypothetical protein